MAEAVKILSENGYTPYEIGKKYQAGDKVYLVNRKKALIMTTFGEKSLEEGIRLNIAHIDSPRLDLKPNPLFEKTDIAYLKTHYYGGIRKYQWATIPLSMHGVVIRKDGEAVNICIGEEEGDPVFCVTDLLPHLAAEQNERKLKDGIKGEELNVIIGSVPYADEEIKEPVKLLVLKLLNDRYGMTEKDFIRAEIELVPAVKAVDVGLDRSLVGAYGQDDKVCGYTALTGTNRELTAVNDRYLQNIGYCRLKNLTVGYTLPRQWTRKALIESLRIYFTGENLFTWSGIRSDYIDPEMAATNGNLRLYPWQRTYMFGVDVTF